jgi:hypothetical protein
VYSKNKFNLVEVSQIIANFMIVIGIFTWFLNYVQTEHIERKKTSIEFLSRMTNPEFVESHARISVVLQNDVDSTIIPHLRQDINNVGIIYKVISLCYENDILDKTIVKKSLSSNVADFVKIRKKLNINVNDGIERFNSLLNK